MDCAFDLHSSPGARWKSCFPTLITPVSDSFSLACVKLTRDLALTSERHGNAVWTRWVMPCSVPMLLPSLFYHLFDDIKSNYGIFLVILPNPLGWALLLALTVLIPQATEILLQSSYHTKMQYHLQPAGPVHVPPVTHLYLSLAHWVDRRPSMTSI